MASAPRWRSFSTTTVSLACLIVACSKVEDSSGREVRFPFNPYREWYTPRSLAAIPAGRYAQDSWTLAARRSDFVDLDMGGRLWVGGHKGAVFTSCIEGTFEKR